MRRPVPVSFLRGQSISGLVRRAPELAADKYLMGCGGELQPVMLYQHGIQKRLYKIKRQMNQSAVR